MLTGSAFGQASSTNQFGPNYDPKASTGFVDNKQEWAEVEAKVPAYPKPDNLLGFEVVAMRNFRFSLTSTTVSMMRSGAP